MFVVELCWSTLSDAVTSNFSQSGTEPKARNETHCFGVMRYGKHCHIEGVDLAETTQIEYLVVSFDDEQRNVKLSLRQADILEALANDEELIKQGGGVPDLAKGEVK